MESHNKLETLVTTSSGSNGDANVTMTPNISASAASTKMDDEQSFVMIPEVMIPEVMRLAPGETSNFQRLIVQSGASGRYFEDILNSFGTPQEVVLLANPNQRPYKHWQNWHQRGGQKTEEDKDTDKGDNVKEYKASEWVHKAREYQDKEDKTPTKTSPA